MSSQGFKKRRLALKLTQRELADKLCVSKRAIQYYEAGKLNPSKSVLKLLSIEESKRM